MPRYSVVVPVYNRPDELGELLNSLAIQRFKDFEVIIIDDGSKNRSDYVAEKFKNDLVIRYVFQENTGQGFARNHGFKLAKGDYILVFDSDCILPAGYMDELELFLQNNHVDAFGGPDAAHPSFTLLQKVINQSMTSFMTTGGTRGKKTHVGNFHPRSFNMGFTSRLYRKIGGYKIPFMGEDLEFSTRILKEGFKTALIPDAFVYHKRRTSIWKFFKQLRYFGRARINLTRFHPDQLKLVHLFPSAFLIGLVFTIMMLILVHPIGSIMLGGYLFYLFLVLLEATISSRSILIGILTPIFAVIQLTAYGWGLLYEWIRKMAGINPNTAYTELY